MLTGLDALPAVFSLSAVVLSERLQLALRALSSRRVRCSERPVWLDGKPLTVGEESLRPEFRFPCVLLVSTSSDLVEAFSTSHEQGGSTVEILYDGQ